MSLTTPVSACLILTLRRSSWLVAESESALAPRENMTDTINKMGLGGGETLGALRHDEVSGRARRRAKQFLMGVGAIMSIPGQRTVVCGRVCRHVRRISDRLLRCHVGFAHQVRVLLKLS